MVLLDFKETFLKWTIFSWDNIYVLNTCRWEHLLHDHKCTITIVSFWIRFMMFRFIYELFSVILIFKGATIILLTNAWNGEWPISDLIFCFGNSNQSTYNYQLVNSLFVKTLLQYKKQMISICVTVNSNRAFLLDTACALIVPALSKPTRVKISSLSVNCYSICFLSIVKN